MPELASLAVARGLDFLAVTDHNTVSHHRELASASAAYGITLVPGQEVTTSRGHAGVLGDTGWIDFRTSADSWLAAAERGGGLMSINHPFGGDVSWLHPMERRPPLLEVWHWSWLDPTWTTPLSWWQAWDPSAIPVGGSDWHRPGSDSPLGTPTTWVECDDDSGVSGVLEGLRAGRVAITASRNGPILVRHDGGFAAIGADGLLLADPDGPYRRIVGDVARLPGRPGYHRLVTPLGATVALTASCSDVTRRRPLRRSASISFDHFFVLLSVLTTFRPICPIRMVKTDRKMELVVRTDREMGARGGGCYWGAGWAGVAAWRGAGARGRV